MIEEDYVSFETAKLLKEKRFPQGAFRCHYIIDGNDHYKSFEDRCGFEDYDIIAPTLEVVTKWLREVHGLHISLEPCYDYDSMHVVFLAFVQNVADVHEFMDGRKNVASYPNAEKCYELAIRYCLENLI